MWITWMPRSHIKVTDYRVNKIKDGDNNMHAQKKKKKPHTYLSAERAVRVNTDTPTEVSWMNGMTLQPTLPNSHSSDR